MLYYMRTHESVKFILKLFLENMLKQILYSDIDAFCKYFNFSFISLSLLFSEYQNNANDHNAEPLNVKYTEYFYD